MIPFTKPYHTGLEIERFSEIFERDSNELQKYAPLCEEYLSSLYKCSAPLLTPSCSSALEMSALLAEVKPATK